ncbi:MAG: hypothetical protein EA412_06030, partial [Chitinophagaceae bacterium]
LDKKDKREKSRAVRPCPNKTTKTYTITTKLATLFAENFPNFQIAVLQTVVVIAFRFSCFIGQPLKARLTARKVFVFIFLANYTLKDHKEANSQQGMRPLFRTWGTRCLNLA